MFHLDEYVGMPIDHPASFRKYLLERLITKTGISRYHFLDCEQDPQSAMERVGRELTRAPIDVAFVGIGENAHLAFNDPPANFDTDQPYLTVTLDVPCRRQQVGEGWFASIEDVPSEAVSMSVRADCQVSGDSLHRPGRAKGPGREGLGGGRRVANDARVDSANASERDVVPGSDSAALLAPSVRGEILQSPTA